MYSCHLLILDTDRVVRQVNIAPHLLTVFEADLVFLYRLIGNGPK